MPHIQHAGRYVSVHAEPLPLEQQEALRDIAMVGNATRKNNTRAAYEPKQRKFEDWCRKRSFPTDELVTPPVALTFIWDYVLTRPNKRNKSIPMEIEKSSTAAQDDAAEQREVNGLLGTGGLPLEELSPGVKVDLDLVAETLQSATEQSLASVNNPVSPLLARLANTTQSVASVKLWVAAIVDLYEHQKTLHLNHYEHPRSAPIRVILQSMKKIAHERNVNTFQEKGKDTYQDGFRHHSQVRRCYEYYFIKNTGEGLRDSLAQALGMYGLLRSDNQRSIHLSDVSGHEFYDEGSTRCTAAVITMRGGKTNSDGKVQYACFIRNKDAMVCPMFFLAAYLFWRFQLASDPYKGSNESFPNLSSRPDWYPLPLLCYTHQPAKAIKYHVQERAIYDALTYAGVITTKKTHIGRIYGARLAEVSGAEYEHIQRAGGWAQSVVSNVYLSSFPMEAIRALAGFPKDKGHYHLDRDVEVPVALQRMVFPQVEKWEARLAMDKKGTKEIAAQGFTTLLRQLRQSFLQDCVIWQQKFPDHLLWKHSLFDSQDWKEYSSYALNEIVRRRNDVDRRIQSSIPIIASALQEIVRTHHQDWSSVRADVSTLTDAARSQGLQLEATQQIVANVLRQLATPLRIQIDRPLDSIQNPVITASSGPLEHNPGEDIAKTAAETTLATIGTVYKMSRTTQTVEQLWREYNSGLSGLPSIKTMYEHSGHKWNKTNDSERKFFQRRQVIWKAVTVLSSKRSIPSEEGALLLDKYRQQQNPPTLNHLEKVLRALSEEEIAQL